MSSAEILNTAAQNWPNIINAALAIGSFILAGISVYLITVTLKQNEKILKNNQEQIIEMRREHQLSMQPVLIFSNPEFQLDRPCLVFSAKDNSFRLHSTCKFSVDIENVSDAVAINVNCTATYDNRDTDMLETPTERLKILSRGKHRICFTFNANNQNKLFESLQADNEPHIFVSAIFSNTTGGHFSVYNKYEIIGGCEATINRWRSLISNFESNYKDKLEDIRRSGGARSNFITIEVANLGEQVTADIGDIESLSPCCIEVVGTFHYEVISDEDYLKQISTINYLQSSNS